METLLRLVQEPDVDTYYLDGGSAVLTQNTNTVHEEHRPVFYQLPDWDLELKPGTQEFVLKVPDQPGEYQIVCTVICSEGHEDMHMKVIVIA